MWAVVEKILISVMSGLAASVVWYYISKVKKLAKKELAIEKGVKALLRDRITQMYLYCDSKRFITIHERECLEGMWEEYKNLGGNGTIEGLVKRLMVLPTSGDTINNSE